MTPSLPLKGNAHSGASYAGSVISSSEDDEFYELDGYDVGESGQENGLNGANGGRAEAGETRPQKKEEMYGNGNGAWDNEEGDSRDSIETARPDDHYSPFLSTSSTPNLSHLNDSSQTPTPTSNGFPSTSYQQPLYRKSEDSTRHSTSTTRTAAKPKHLHNTGLGIAFDPDSVDMITMSVDDRFENENEHEQENGHIVGLGNGYAEVGPSRGRARRSGIGGIMERLKKGLGINSELGIGREGGAGVLSSQTIRMRRMKYFRESAVTGVFVLCWYFFATLLSLYNKWMFSPLYYGFTYPLFVTANHMVVQFFLAWVVRLVWSERFRPREKPGKEDYVKKIVPTAITTGMDIGLSNLSLKTITLTLYTMCKSSALIFVIGFAFLFHLEVYSLRLLLVITFISFGVFLMVFNATTVSIPGIIMVFAASALGGLRWALTQLLMHKKEMGMSNPFATIYWLAPIMAVTLGLVSMVLEGWLTIFKSDFFGGWKGVQTVMVIVFPGALAFSMVASEYYIIQRAGIVPLSIAGIFKEVSTITVSAWVFGDELTKLNELGVIVTIGGIALYSYHKYQKSVMEPEDDNRQQSHDLESYEAYETLGLQAQEGAYPSQRLSFAGDDLSERDEDFESGEEGHHAHVLGDEDDGEDEERAEMFGIGKKRVGDGEDEDDDGVSNVWGRNAAKGGIGKDNDSVGIGLLPKR